MNEPVFALLLGLALITAAAGLMWKLKKQGEAGSVNPTPPVAAQPTEKPQTDTFSGGRRRRRQWAAEKGFEYSKSDSQLAEVWPQLLSGAESEATVARDVVSGFYGGHPVQIGDLRGATIVAMRRAAASPVHVLFNTEGSVPHGLRRAERCDIDPYFAYTTDLRALERMLDDRVQDGLAALRSIADHIEWVDRWLFIRVPRKLDPSVWDQILPYQQQMVDAAMILPPPLTNIPLEFEHADPTRALPGVTWRIATSAEGNMPEAEESENDRPGHLQAVPDEEVPAENSAGEDSYGVEEERPDITRPAHKVEFPTRTYTRVEGDTKEFSASHLAEDTEEAIPVLGEDPDHINPSTAARPHVRRSRSDEGPTIFADAEETTDQATPWRSGKHRKPDARHARPEPIEAVEIETVDAEVVDINHRRKGKTDD